MAVVPPTAADLKARYPEFDPVSDARVDLFIGDAARMVGDNWCPDDQQRGILALAAHYLVMEGEPERSNGSTIAPINLGRLQKRRTVGDVTVEYADGAGSSNATSSGTVMEGLQRSEYGKRFARLMKLNVPSIGAI